MAEDLKGITDDCKGLIGKDFYRPQSISRILRVLKILRTTGIF
jgi:hypothetical protein